MFEFITNLFRPSASKKQMLPTLTDPLFGPLVFFPAATVWSGKAEFSPLNHEIEILIDAGDSGPAQAQRDFFQQTIAHWPEIQISIGDILFPPIKKWAKKDYDENNPWGYFELRGIRVPSLLDTPVEWAVSYWCPSVRHFFDIQMSDWKADGLTITRK